MLGIAMWTLGIELRNLARVRSEGKSGDAEMDTVVWVRIRVQASAQARLDLRRGETLEIILDISEKASVPSGTGAFLLAYEMRFLRALWVCHLATLFWKTGSEQIGKFSQIAAPGLRHSPVDGAG